MNDNAFMCSHEVRRRGGLGRTSVPELNRALRRNIHSARQYARPIDLAKQRAATS